jgi:DNA-nicking Smr family endonuclease
MTDQPVPLPIEGVLDLHTFRPQDISQVVPAYLEACRQAGLLEVRIIHGKGRGQLRRGLEALLARLPEVISWAPASPLYGGLGATIVRLRPPDSGTPR